MRDQQELRVAWILWEMLTDITQSLWDRYEDGFVEIIIEEEESKERRQAMQDAHEGSSMPGDGTERCDEQDLVSFAQADPER